MPTNGADTAPPAGSRTRDVVVVTYGQRPEGANPSAAGTSGDIGPTTAAAPQARVTAGGRATSDGRAGPAEASPAAARDAEVRRHEAAHMAVLGGLAGGPVIYDTIRDSQGQTQAVGAKLKVDLAEVPGNPRETLRRARRVQMAATAPGSPSAADTRVAAEARRLAQTAAREIQAAYGSAHGARGSSDGTAAIAHESRPGELVNELV